MAIGSASPGDPSKAARDLVHEGVTGSRPRRPAFLLCLGVSISLILLAVAHRSYDTDVWQHLRVGRAIWQLHEIPRTNLWTWPTFGAPYDIPSWLFRVVLWPFWAAFGERGLDLWRWSTAVALFALLFAAARRAAGRAGDGLPTLAILVWSALLWRARWECRPETLAALFLATEIVILEWRRTQPRSGRPWRDVAWWLVPLQLLWINVHISYYLGLVIGVAYVLDGYWRRSRGNSSSDASRLLLILLAAGCACLVNPFGFRAIVQPFDFFLHGRYELIFQYVDELQPINWSENIRNGLPLYLAALLGVALWRWRRVGFDPAQAVLLAVLLPQALATNRFLGFFVIATAPLFARDVELVLAGTKPPPALRSSWPRALALACPILLLCGFELTRSLPAFGMGPRWDRVPVRACDYIVQNNMVGHGYNMYWHGGYLLWRFWPDRGRLPFMDIHQTGLREDRDAQVQSMMDSSAWQALDARHRFDWVLLPTVELPGQHLMDWLDADSTRWSLVFADDAASLFVRSEGTFGLLAARDGYRCLRMGERGYGRLQQRALADSTIRARLRSDLDRAVASSPWNSRARSLRASVALIESRWTDARNDLEAGLVVSPGLSRAHDRLAYALIMSGEPARALEEIRTARTLGMTADVANRLIRQAEQAQASRPAEK